jgi:hypothetical protein
MYFILLACLNSVIGSSFYNWWADTRIGCWSNRKLNQLLTWTTRKLHLKEFSRVENVMDKIQRLEGQIEDLETQIRELRGFHINTEEKH